MLAEYSRLADLNRTSVWTFAKPGTGKYSSITRDTFLGFGVSATSLLQDTFKINTFSIEDYIRRVNEDSLPTSLTLHFTKRQRAVYFLFWSAYALKIDPAAFEKIVGVPLRRMFGLEVFWAEKLGFLRRNAGAYELTDKATGLYHHIEQVYTTAYIDKMWHISRNQAFPAKIVLK
jgi:oxygen-independent coproporphyrinogen-3 oxidase